MFSSGCGEQVVLYLEQKMKEDQYTTTYCTEKMQSYHRNGEEWLNLGTKC